MRQVYLYTKKSEVKPVICGICWVDQAEWSAGVLLEPDEERAYVSCLLMYMASRVPQNIEIFTSNKNLHQKLKAYIESRAYFFGTNRENSLLWDKFDGLVNKWSSLIKVKYVESAVELDTAKKYVNKILEVTR